MLFEGARRVISSGPPLSRPFSSALTEFWGDDQRSAQALDPWRVIRRCRCAFRERAPVVVTDFFLGIWSPIAEHRRRCRNFAAPPPRLNHSLPGPLSPGEVDTWRLFTVLPPSGRTPRPNTFTDAHHPLGG